VSVVGAVLLALLVVALSAALWLALHHDAVRALGRRIASLPPLRRVAAAAHRHDVPASLARHLGVEQAVALVLVVGLVAVAGLGVVFAYLLDGVLDGDGIAHVDQPVSGWLAAHRDGSLTAVFRAVTQLGGPPGLAVQAGVAAAVAAWAVRSWLPVLLVATAGGGIGLMIAVVKALAGRPRPPRPYTVLIETGWSFPSGHAAGTATIAFCGGWVLTRWAVRAWAARVVMWTVVLLLVGAVGLSRVYLGVHYVSDVLAGWVLGALWAGTVVLVGTWWDAPRRGRRPT
jgi:undecaprenyl-diphosphatase